MKLITNCHLLIREVKKWFKNNKFEAFLLLIILFISSIFRLYRIDEYMTFLGDEGRDAIIVRRLLVNFDPILIGPGTSIGNMYLGPIYYYMIAPFLLIFNFSPVGPSVFVALLGIATVFFVWFVIYEWFPSTSVKKGFLNVGALSAAGLYAVAPVVINLSRSSWNPNIMPFFSLLTIFSIWKFWGREKLAWLIVAFVSVAIALQSHYLGLLLLPVVCFFWILTLFGLLQVLNTSRRLLLKQFINYSVFGFFSFLLLMLPLVIFDFRHNFINFNAMKKFFLERQTTVSIRPWTAFPKLPVIVSDSLTSLITAKNSALGKSLSLFLLVGIGFLIFYEVFYIKSRKIKFIDSLKPYTILIFWLAVSFLGLGLYKQHIYDHYYGFFFTAPFILMGGLGQWMIDKFKIIGTLLVFFVFSCLLLVNLQANPLKYPPNRQMQRAMVVAEKIKQEAKGKKFNLAVIAERNYEDGYQYFLEKWREPVYDIDPLNYESTLGYQLFVVCELPKKDCDPVHNPKTEIANFGWSEIEGEWEVAGVTLYKLIHSER